MLVTAEFCHVWSKFTVKERMHCYFYFKTAVLETILLHVAHFFCWLQEEKKIFDCGCLYAPARLSVQRFLSAPGCLNARCTLFLSAPYRLPAPACLPGNFCLHLTLHLHTCRYDCLQHLAACLHLHDVCLHLAVYLHIGLTVFDLYVFLYLLVAACLDTWLSICSMLPVLIRGCLSARCCLSWCVAVWLLVVSVWLLLPVLIRGCLSVLLPVLLRGCLPVLLPVLLRGCLSVLCSMSAHAFSLLVFCIWCTHSWKRSADTCLFT